MKSTPVEDDTLVRISLPVITTINGKLAKLQRDTRVEENDRPMKLTQPDAPGQAPEQPGANATVELFEKAVQTHSRRLLAIARAIVGTRASPEDVVQQAVTNLFQHRHRYDWREPGGLLKRAVVNESLRLLRHPRMAMVGEEHPDSTETPIEGMVENETTQQVKA